MRGYYRLYFFTALSLLVFLTIRLLWIAWPFTTDDAYITFKYGRSLAEGNGLVWNIGEPPLEGYSNFIFVLFSAFFSYLNIDPVIPIRIINYASLVGTLYLTWLITSLWAGPLISLVPPIILALFFEGTVFWAASGLETAFFQFITLLALYLSFRFLADGEGAAATPARTRDILFLGFLLAVVAMTRPEGALYFMIILLAAWMGFFLPSFWKQNRWKDAGFRDFLNFNWRLAGTFILVYGCYWLWRYNYFGYPFPNPYYCKVASYSQGDNILLDDIFASVTPYLWAGLIAVVYLRDLRIAALFIPAAAYIYLLRGVDPIVGYFIRHYMAALAALLPLSVILVKKVSSRLLAGRIGDCKTEAVLFTAFIFLIPNNYIRVEDEIVKNVDRYVIRTETRTDAANFLLQTLPADATYVNGDAGLIPYLTVGLNSIDAYCLNDIELAHKGKYNDPKAAAEYFLGREPEAIVMLSHKKNKFITKARIWTGLVNSPEFNEKYELKNVFGHDGDTFWYFTYYRK